MVVLYFRKGDSGPAEEDIAALVPVDEHDTIQRGKLLGNVQRSEDELYLTHPDWVTTDGDESGIIVDIEKKVPLPLSDASGREKRLWILRDKGHIDCVSASTIVSEKIPKRWDLPLIDWRRIFRHLEGNRGASSLGGILGTRQGILAVTGFILVGNLIAFFLITASGHLR